jgi:hypothetical protein
MQIIRALNWCKFSDEIFALHLPTSSNSGLTTSDISSLEDMEQFPKDAILINRSNLENLKPCDISDYYHRFIYKDREVQARLTDLDIAPVHQQEKDAISPEMILSLLTKQNKLSCSTILSSMNCFLAWKVDYVEKHILKALLMVSIAGNCKTRSSGIICVSKSTNCYQRIYKAE